MTDVAMSHPIYDPDAPLALPLEWTFHGIRIGFMGMYDLGFPPLDDDWIIAEGHHGHDVFLRAANDLYEHEREARPFDQTATTVRLWAVNLAKCPDLYTCTNKICQRYGGWQLYADWVALWTDGDKGFTADTPGALPVTVLNPRDWSEAFCEAREEAERKWRAENPPLTFP